MNTKKLCRNSSLIMFLAGLFFLINSQIQITGAVIGNDLLPPSISSVYGIFLVFIAFILVLTNNMLFGKKPKSKIHLDHGLERLAGQAGKNQQVQRGLDHLAGELAKGNREAGLGKPGHIHGTKIYYLRDRGGARLYFEDTNNGPVIVGKSGKSNQQKVIDRLKELYS